MNRNSLILNYQINLFKLIKVLFFYELYYTLSGVDRLSKLIVSNTLKVTSMKIYVYHIVSMKAFLLNYLKILKVLHFDIMAKCLMSL